MNNIFNRKVIFERRRRIIFDSSLHKKIEEQIYEELSDYLFIFHSPKKNNILFINSQKRFEEAFFLKNFLPETDFENIGYLDLSVNDADNTSNIAALQKSDIIAAINCLHNINSLEEYIYTIKNNLMEGGIFCGNFYGTQNLVELKKLIFDREVHLSRKVHQRFHPNISGESLTGLLQKFGFRDIVILPEKISFTFNSFKEAAKFLKNINERNALHDIQKGGVNRAIFIDASLGKINLDFEILKFYCHI